MAQEIDIKWYERSEALVPGTCLACGTKGPMAPVCEVLNLHADAGLLKFACCAQCKSLTVIQGSLYDYTDNSQMSDASWRHYIHIGAGIDFMARPIQRVATQRSKASLLDVGCGFGYTLDFFRALIGGDIAGVEPSTYGVMGRDMLGLPIEISYLSEVESLAGKRFDIVFSSEVIEHVPQPGVFIDELEGHLAEKGVLILTTPNAAYVSPRNTLSSVAATLSPGLHRVLFSSIALESLLRSKGFTYVKIEELDERLLVFASRENVLVKPVDRLLHQQYLFYLLQRAAEPTAHVDVEVGFRYRAFKELVNLGRVTEARMQAEALASVMRIHFGLDPLDQGLIVKRVLSATSFEDYANMAPYCLGPFLFYFAMMRRVAGEDPRSAAQALSFAEEVLVHMIRIAPFEAQEASSLLWPSVMEQACALTACNEHRSARHLFAKILNSKEVGEPWSSAFLSKELFLRAQIEDRKSEAAIMRLA